MENFNQSHHTAKKKKKKKNTVITMKNLSMIYNLFVSFVHLGWVYWELGEGRVRGRCEKRGIYVSLCMTNVKLFQVD